MSGYASPLDRHHNTPSYIPSSSFLSSRSSPPQTPGLPSYRVGQAENSLQTRPGKEWRLGFVSDREDMIEASMGRWVAAVPPPVPAPGSGCRMASAIVGGLEESVGQTVSSVPPPVSAPGSGRMLGRAIVEGKVREFETVRRVVGPSAPPCVVPAPTSNVPALVPKAKSRLDALEESVGCMAAAMPPPSPPSTPTPTPTPTPTGGVRLQVSNEGGDLTFPLPNRKIQACTVDVNIRNKDGTMRFERPAASNWNTGLWATLLITAGTAYWYRNELRIIGRGIMAGANLAIERWEKEKQKNERSESVGWPPAHTNANNNIRVQCPGCKTDFRTRTEYNGHRLTNSCPLLDSWKRERALQSQQAQKVPATFPQEAQGQAHSLREPRPNWGTLNPRTNDCFPNNTQMSTAAADPVWRKAHTNETEEQMMMGDAITMHNLEVTLGNGQRAGGVQLTPESSDAYEGDAEDGDGDGDERFQTSEEGSSSSLYDQFRLR